MKKTIKIILSASALLLLCSCGIKKINTEVSSTVAPSTGVITESTTAEATTKAESTTEKETEGTTKKETTKATTTAVKTTAKKTTKAAATTSTTKKATTTTKKATTTTKVFTTIPTTTKAQPQGNNYITRTRTEHVKLKYDVYVSRSLRITYQVVFGREKEVSRETVAEVFDRTLYNAKYSDLLPAAKANRKTYSAYIDEALRITNEMRAEKNLPPLTLNSTLTDQACARAEEIAWSGKHSHTRPNGSYFSTIFKENGFQAGKVAENIGWNYPTPAKICQAWKNSEGHYANIISKDYVSIGIGVAPDCDKDGTLVWVQHFYSVNP